MRFKFWPSKSATTSVSHLWIEKGLALEVCMNRGTGLWQPYEVFGTVERA